MELNHKTVPAATAIVELKRAADGAQRELPRLRTREDVRDVVIELDRVINQLVDLGVHERRRMQLCSADFRK